MAKKKPKIPPEMAARFAENQRRLEERIAYHERKLAEEQERGGDTAQK
jgi:hypothetical protein